MNLSMAAIGGQTVAGIVVTCLVVALAIFLIVMMILYKREKLSGRSEMYMGKLNNTMSTFKQLSKNKLVLNKNSKEMIFYWTVLILGIVTMVLSFAFEMLIPMYSLELLRNLLFLFMLVFMISFNNRFAPTGSYYYEFNPILFIYAAITLVFSIVDFVDGISSGILSISLLYTFTFIGNLLFYGTIVLTRFSKSEFKPRDLLVYFGALIIIVIDVAYFFLFLKIHSLLLATRLFGMLYGIGVMMLLLYFYDSFSFVKRILKASSGKENSDITITVDGFDDVDSEEDSSGNE